MQTAVIVQRLVRFSDAIRPVVTLAQRQVAVLYQLTGHQVGRMRQRLVPFGID
jgi:methionine aminopeptidase